LAETIGSGERGRVIKPALSNAGNLGIFLQGDQMTAISGGQ
jgi:hypothetical protein